MAFENMFVSVGGIRKWLENCDLSAFTINDLSSTYRCRSFSGNTDPLLEYNMDLSYGDAGFEEWKNVFGFFIYDSTTGEFTGKILWYRIYCYLHQVVDPSDNYIWGFYHRWSIFDSDTQQYSEIVTGPNPVASGGANQLRLPSCKIIFSKMVETYQNEEQDMFYGGLLTYKYFEGTTIAEGNAIALPSKAGLESMGYSINPEEIVIDPDLGPESGEDGYGPDPGGKSPTGGGSGGPGPTFDETSDPWIDYPIKPGIAALGLVNLYKCDVGSLVNLGAELFPDIHFPTSLSDIGAVIAAVSDSIWNSKLIDYIVSTHIVPVDVTGGAVEDIKVGTRTLTGILARPISDDIVKFDCGTVHIDEYYTGFADYMTRAKLYLPFHGFVELKPEYWQSADLQVKYLFNVIDGSFTAQVFSTVTRHQKPFKSLIGQYTGCACVHVPLTGPEYASMFSGMIANAGTMAMAAGTANPAMGAAAALNLYGTAVTGNAGNASGSNAYNASAGFYGHPCPYLIIERPISNFSSRYPSESGLPLNVSKRIGDCQGLTICDDPVLNFGCPEEVGKAIKDALQEGVIV